MMTIQKRNIGIITFATFVFILICLCIQNYHRNNNEIDNKDVPNDASGLSKVSKSLVFIGIYSHINNKQQRDAIRKTWLKKCPEDTCLYRFFIYRDFANKTIYHEDQKIPNDELYDSIILRSISIGVQLDEVIRYAAQLSRFSYFIFVNDKHYLCLDKLLYELERRLDRVGLYWGNGNCGEDFFIERDFSIMSRDFALRIIKDFPGEDSNKAFIEWNQIKGVITWFTDNDRILKQSENKHKDSIKSMKNVCNSYIAVGGIEVTDTMMEYHQIAGSLNNMVHSIPQIVNICDD